MAKKQQTYYAVTLRDGVTVANKKGQLFHEVLVPARSKLGAVDFMVNRYNVNEDDIEGVDYWGNEEEAIATQKFWGQT
jgi:hypothetical protein